MNLLRLERRRKGWRQIDLSEAAGVSQTLIWILETSRGKSVSREAKQRIANALDCSMESLFPEVNGEKKDESS